MYLGLNVCKFLALRNVLMMENPSPLATLPGRKVMCKNVTVSVSLNTVDIFDVQPLLVTLSQNSVMPNTKTALRWLLQKYITIGTE